MKLFIYTKSHYAAVISLLLSHNILSISFDDLSPATQNSFIIVNNTVKDVLKIDYPMNDDSLKKSLGNPYSAMTNNGVSGVAWTDPAQWIGDISYGLSGFVNQTDSTMSFDNSSRTFTIEPTAPLAHYLVYFKGKYFTKTAAETFQITNSEGIHYIYFDGTGKLIETFTFAECGIGAIVAFLYWSLSDQQAILFAEERHTCHRDIAWHIWTHATIGFSYESGLAISEYIKNVDSLAAIEIGISDGAVHDADIEIDIKNSLASTNRFEQPIAAPAQIPVLYRSGPLDCWHADSVGLCPYKNEGPYTRVQYNKYVDAETGWTQEVVSDGRYVAYFIFATNSIKNPIVAIQGIRQDATLSDAINNNSYTSVASLSLPFNEMYLLYRIILKANSAYTNPYKATISIVNDMRSIATNTLRTESALNHSTLTQRNDIESHPAVAIAVDSASFSGTLNTADNNVQLALAKIDSRLNQNLNTTNAPTFAGMIASDHITLNATKELRFADTNSSNYVALKAARTIPSNVTWTLPATDGTLNQSLVTNGAGIMSWATIPQAEIYDYPLIPPFTVTPNNAYLNAPTTFVGAVYSLQRDVTFSKIVFRLNAYTAPGRISMYLYQTPTGVASTAGSPAIKIAGITSTAPVAGVNAIAIDGGSTATLKVGIVYVLWGRSSATGSFSMRSFTSVSSDLFNNDNMLANTYPTTYTTTINANTTPATFNAYSQSSATATNTAAALRIINF